MTEKLHNFKCHFERTDAGFSMIEVLVASAILTIIVMMMGMLFQQTGLAWRAGSKRAEGYMQVRSFVGALQRDAENAIDRYGMEMMWTNRVASLNGGKKGGKNPPSDVPQFQGSACKFYALSGNTPERNLCFITYDGSGRGKRTVKKWDGSGNSLPDEVSNLKTSIGQQSNPNHPTVNVSFDLPGEAKNPYKFKDDRRNDCLPLFMTIHAEVTSSGYGTEIGAASAGPDKQWNTKDDITTWSKRN